MEGARRFVADDHPCRPWQPFVHDFGYDSDIGIAISCCHEAFVNVGYPELGESGIEGGQEKGEDVEKKGAIISGLIEWKIM